MHIRIVYANIYVIGLTPLAKCLQIRQSSIEYTRLIVRPSHRPSVWCSKYYFFLAKFFWKILSFFFLYNFAKIKIVLSALSPSQQPTVLSSICQNNICTIRRLVDKMISVLYWRLSDFTSVYSNQNSSSFWGWRFFSSEFFPFWISIKIFKLAASLPAQEINISPEDNK